MGTQVVVPFREEDDKLHLKPMGDLGQIVPMVSWSLFHPRFTITDDDLWLKEWDLTHPDQIEECVRHSDIVYNLVGRDFETK